MPRIQLESGIRNVIEDEVSGHKVRVITGYEIGSDSWPVHVYVDGAKIEGRSTRADAMAEAIDAGFQIAQQEIDSRS